MFTDKDFEWYNFTPTLDDEVQEQEQEVKHFRAVEKFLPEERCAE